MPRNRQVRRRRATLPRCNTRQLSMSATEGRRGRIHGPIAVGFMFAILVAPGYIVAHLPFWACVPIAVGAMVVNSFALRVEDSKSFDRNDSGR